MTRKEYIHRIQNLMIAVYNHPESIFPKCFKLGDSLKHARDYAKEVPKNFGSYAAAWNSESMKWAREHYGIN